MSATEQADSHNRTLYIDAEKFPVKSYVNGRSVTLISAVTNMITGNGKPAYIKRLGLARVKAQLISECHISNIIDDLHHYENPWDVGAKKELVREIFKPLTLGRAIHERLFDWMTDEWYGYDVFREKYGELYRQEYKNGISAAKNMDGLVSFHRGLSDGMMKKHRRLVELAVWRWAKKAKKWCGIAR